ncbi:MAG TPA: DUF5686 family protein, partial [Bacteroidia bacterium]|nr:DUF5686 family protein [Bacteroidia bacterium]
GVKEKQRRIFSEAVNIFLLLFLFISVSAFSQTTRISGRVTDALTNEPIGFANIFFKGTTQGTRADMDGNYKAETEKPVDTLIVTFLGYKTVNMKLKRGQTQVINISLRLNQFELNAVEIKAGENPADILMRKVVENRDKNNRENISAYQYEVYNKLEFDINNISEKFKRKKVLKPIAFIFNNIDSSETNKKPFLPIFVSESLSNFYYTSSPSQKKEIIKATKISGVDNATVTQFLGDMYQNVNIYRNYIDLFKKSFVSPLNGSGFFFYKFFLTDSSFMDNQWCYKIVFKPKRKQELTFSGEVWIHDTTFAVKKINMRMSPDANINFVEDIAIVQEFVLLNGNDSVWMKKKDIYVVDFLSQNEGMGFIGRKTASYKNFVINQPKPDSFFESSEDISMSDSAFNYDEAFWLSARHDSLSKQEKAVYHMVDTIKSLPIYRTYVDVITFLFTGYKTFGKIEIGPFPKMYSFNKYEGNRFRLGGRTSTDFSKDLTLEAYGAWGSLDEKFKYSGLFKYYISRKPWMSVGAVYKRDVEEFGQSQSAFQGYRIAGRQKDDVFQGGDIVSSILRRVQTNKFTNVEDMSGFYEVDWKPGFSTKFQFIHRSYAPLGDLDYAYYTNGTDGTTRNALVNSEISITARFAIREKFIQGKRNRLSLGSSFPIFFVNYTRGFKDVLNSDFEYNKISTRIDGKFTIRPLGYSMFLVEAGQTFETLPYPLLEVHRGNETFSYRHYAFNMMNYYEFVSDRYVLALISHHFNGLFFDKLPLLR